MAELARLGFEVEWGRSQRKPVQVLRRQMGRNRVRLHRAFESAPPEVTEALAEFLSGAASPHTKGRLRDWCRTAIGASPARREACGHGLVHDLDALAGDLWDGFLEGRIPPAQRPRLCFGSRRRSRTRGSLRLGSYEPRSDTVRIHPVLDSAEVPTWFVRTILVHELLHVILPARVSSTGRRAIHHAEFRQWEARWPDHDAAREFERANLPAWIRRARKG